MRRLLAWAIWLYPASWRARYRDELEALVEDSKRAGWTEVIDLVKGAALMNLRTWPAVRMMLLAGLAAAALAWAFAPRFYRSEGLVWTDGDSRLINKAAGEVLASDFRDEDWRRIRIRRVDSERFSVAFEDRDPAVARVTAFRLQQRLVARLQKSGGSVSAAVGGAGLAQRQWLPIGPFAAIGLMGGAIMALLRRATARFLGAFCVAGALVGGLACSIIPSVYRSTASFEVGGPADAGEVLQTTRSEVNALYPDPGNFDRVRVSRVERIRLGTGEETRALTVSFDDRDPRQARVEVERLEKRIIERFREQGILVESLDHANLPRMPAYPTRGSLMGCGATAGLVIGGFILFWRRQVLAGF